MKTSEHRQDASDQFQDHRPIQFDASQDHAVVRRLGPSNVQDAPPAPTSVPLAGVAAPVAGVSNRPNTYRNSPSQPPLDNDEQNGSYGTLVLSKGGRSKYLGPTAGSEFLKDARSLASKSMLELICL